VRPVAALYVEGDGPYIGLEGVDAWDVQRDARQYRGPHPVVAHPPCKRWGNFWYGSPSDCKRYHRGDDGGTFAAALWAVRTFGGVLEHPADSSAWDWFGLHRPPRLGWGWGEADRFGGRSCSVTQGRYGHAGRKETWLYSVVETYPRLDWAEPTGVRPVEHLSQRQRLLTPEPFRDMLLAMVRA
jgi:hypothetical protein